ncbi:MAG: tetratricopeptide repeat protein [Draconibacterium sp.]
MYLVLNQIDTGKYYLNNCKTRCLELFETNPYDRGNLQNLSTLYMEMGELFSAIEIADQMLDINPHDSWAIITNFFLTFSIGDFQTANRYCEIAVVECPEDPATYFLKTILLFMVEWSEASRKNAFEGFKADFSYLDKIQDTFKHNPEIKLVTESCKLYVLFIENVGKIIFNSHRYEAENKIN